MPLLEFGSEKPLTQRFSFLNLADDKNIDVKQETSSLRHVNILEAKPMSERKRSNDVAPQSDFKVVTQDMHAVGVIKTTLGSSKLFINLTTPNTQDGQSGIKAKSPFYCSNVAEDKDKSGTPCSVMTVLDVKARVNLDLDTDVQSLLEHVRKVSKLEIGSKYTLPRMRKKGKLSPVSTLHDADIQHQMIAGNTAVPETNSVVKVLEKHDSKSSSGGSKHCVDNLAVAAIALPLPTRYTHHFSVALPSVSNKASWSVYFDSQDTTLKVLLPPQEDFITLVAALDDFRAFTKDGHLHIFFIGAP